MLDGQVKGYFLLGENPAVGSSNARLHRLALAELDWLVVGVRGSLRRKGPSRGKPLQG